eukprot:362470-Alexandrium_andersonii.AAC.1
MTQCQAPSVKTPRFQALSSAFKRFQPAAECAQERPNTQNLFKTKTAQNCSIRHYVVLGRIIPAQERCAR